MALFSKKQKIEEKADKKTSASDVLPAIKSDEFSKVSITHNVSSVLLHPRITEKSSMLSEKGFYVFEVNKRANKHDVAEAIKKVYGFTPEKINITNLPSKNVFSRGKRGVKSGVKKAVVFLKKGDKIEFV